MKLLPVFLFIALSMPGCSHYSTNARNERSYYKYLKQTNAARGVRQTRVIKQERASMPATRPAPTPPPEEKGPQAVPENQ